jgi:hypothetical protein
MGAKLEPSSPVPLTSFLPRSPPEIELNPFLKSISQFTGPGRPVVLLTVCSLDALRAMRTASIMWLISRFKSLSIQRASYMRWDSVRATGSPCSLSPSSSISYHSMSSETLAGVTLRCAPARCPRAGAHRNQAHNRPRYAAAVNGKPLIGSCTARSPAEERIPAL